MGKRPIWGVLAAKRCLMGSGVGNIFYELLVQSNFICFTASDDQS
jgi:hypothetical protein